MLLYQYNLKILSCSCSWSVDWTHDSVSTIDPHRLHIPRSFPHAAVSSSMMRNPPGNRPVSPQSGQVIPRLSSTCHHSRPLTAANSFTAAAMWTADRRLRALRLRWPPWHGLLPMALRLHRLSRSMPHRNRQLLSSASGLGCDRRDADHGRARGDRAIHQDAAGRACLSAGADPEAARPRAGRDRGIARHRALHAARGRPGQAAGGALPRAQRALPVDPRAGAGAAAVLSRRRDQPPRRRPAHAQRRIFQAHRCAQLHHAA